MDPIDPSQLVTFAALLTAPTPIVGAVIRQIVEVLKRMFPILDARISGLRLSYYVAAALAVLAFALGTDMGQEGALAAFWAFLAWSQNAVGLDATLNQWSQRKDAGISEGVPDEPDDFIGDTPAGQP
jgi:hypothetical protein